MTGFRIGLTIEAFVLGADEMGSVTDIVTLFCVVTKLDE